MGTEELFDVEAREIGFFDNSLRHPGDRFQVTEKQFSSWMVKVGPLPPALPASEVKKQDPSEAERLRVLGLSKTKEEQEAALFAQQNQARVAKEKEALRKKTTGL